MKITSRDNQKLKAVRKIRDAGGSLVFIEGLRLAEEVRRSGSEVEEVFCSETFVSNPRSFILLDEFHTKNIPAYELPDKIFKTISATKNPQGIILIIRKPETGQKELQVKTSQSRWPIVVLLDKINNPSNLGAVFRTAEAAGAAGVIVTKNSASVFSPKALRGSMGSCLRLPVWENADFFEALRWAGENDLETVCADIKGDSDYRDLDWKKPRLLVFGSEAHGLNNAQKDAVSESVHIPLANKVESLNLAVACAVVLFEAKRQTNQ